MRTFLSGVSVLLCGLLFMGAVNAPVMQSQSYYINDHADVIAQENRDSMLEAAQKLYGETGARAVLLTIENLDGRTPEQYAEAVYNAWEIGAGGTGLLLLLSTEEKRFAIWSNEDIPVTDALAEADELAEAGQFDLAAHGCFEIIIDSMHRILPVKTEMTPKSSVVDNKDTQAILNTQDIERTGISVPKNDIFIMILILLLVLIFMRAGSRDPKRRQQAAQNASVYLRKIYSPDEPIAVRTDDLDCPSGFGGLGNRKAIYFEDVDDAEDIGIIRRRHVTASGEEAGEHKTVNE